MTELFRLLGTIAVNNEEAIRALNETSESGSKAESKLGGAFKKIGGAAVAVGKAVAVGMTAAAVAVGGLVGKSVQSYADYEQLVGGVETLFGAGGQSIEEYAKSVGKSVDEASAEYEKLMSAQGKVLEYANKAYADAGMSANEYMETVTGFSASLIQSVGGDTEKAAEKANQALIDMSDNANKMGSNMEDIKNAYSGFAKQNYTMLDNLKLGYGGTQEEMKRLLADAQAISGVKYDISSYADVVDAIHVIQTEMGIAGTTADEAATTISGSLGMMKSSWANVVTAIASDELPFDEYLNNFIDSVATFGENIIPRIEIALQGVVKLVERLAPLIIEKIPGLISTLLPAIIQAATSLVDSLANAFPGIIDALISVLPQLINGFKTIINSLIEVMPQIIQAWVNAIPQIVPLLINAFFSIFDTLAANFTQIIQPIITAIPGLVVQIVNCLLDNVWNIIDGVMLVVTQIIEMLPEIIPLLVEAITEVVRLIIAYLPDILDEIVGAVLLIVDMLAEQLPVILPMLTDAIILIITMLTEQLPIIIPMLIEATITIVNALIEALPDIIMALADAIPGILQAVWDAIVMVFQNLPAWIMQLLEGIWSIISNIWGAIGEMLGIDTEAMWATITSIWEAIKGFIVSAAEAIKSFISGAWNAIKSTTSSIWNGIKSTISGVWEGIKSTVSNVANGVKSTISGVWESIKSTTSTLWNGIKTAITTPIETAKNTIKNIVDTIKGFFSGMKLEFPKIKMPHFSISPSGWKIGDLLDGSIPKLGIEWYAKAMDKPQIMTSPTVFGYNPSTGKLMGGGDAGSEVVSGTNTLMNMISQAVASQNGGIIGYLQQLIAMLADYLPQIIANSGQDIVTEDGTIIAHFAPLFDEEFGRMKDREDRGR